jgi:protein SCO1/2
MVFFCDRRSRSKNVIVNKRALYAVMVALLLPLVFFFVFQAMTKKATRMPGHYLPDSLVTVTRKGKRVTDTAWHQVKDFSLTNQEGKTVTWDSLRGKIVIMDFFFTHCPTICPGLTRNMKRMAESINNGERVGDRTNKQVQFISMSIDPERDSVPRLKYWADRFQINPGQWWLLTGPKKEIYDIILHEIKIPVEDGEGVDSNFAHTDHFVLIDSNRYVRGYYHGLDSVSLAQLSNDLILLTLEKGKNEKSFFADKLMLIAIVFLVAIFGVGLLLFVIRKRPS